MRGVGISHSRETAKIIILNYDAITALPGDKCLFCLSDKAQMILLALIETLSWKTRWYSPTGQTIDQAVLHELKAEVATELMADQCETIKTSLDEILEAIHTVEGKVDTANNKIDGVQLDLNTFQADELQDDLLKDLALAAIATDLTTLSAAVALDSAAIAGIAALLSTTSGEVHDVHIVVDDILTAVNAIDCSTPVVNLQIINNYGDNIQIGIVLPALTAPSEQIPDKTWTIKSGETEMTAQYARWCALVRVSQKWIDSTLYRVIYQTDISSSSLADLWSDLAAIGGYLIGTIFEYGVFSADYPTIEELEAAAADSAARFTVACDLARALSETGVDFGSWLAAINTLAYTAATNEDLIASLLQAVAGADIVLKSNYAAWLSGLPEAFQNIYATLPTSYDCGGCFPFDLGVDQVWDLTVGQKLPWLITRGLYVPGTGIVGTEIPGDGSNVGCEFWISFPDPGVAFDTIKFHGLIQASGGNKAFVETWRYVAGVETYVGSGNLSSTGALQDFTITSGNPGVWLYSKIHFRTNSPIYQTTGATIIVAEFDTITLDML